MRWADNLSLEEQGPRFKKSPLNGWLYNAQMVRNGGAKAKINKLEVKWGVDVSRALKAVKRGKNRANVKGFMWLLLNHALPVAARPIGAASPLCKRCGLKRESISHATFKCPEVKELYGLVCREWDWRLGKARGPPSSFKEALLEPPRKGDWEEERRYDLMALTAHASWLGRNSIVFKGEAEPPLHVRAAGVWTLFEYALKARENRLNSLVRWWEYRVDLETMSPKRLGVICERIGWEKGDIARLLRPQDSSEPRHEQVTQDRWRLHSMDSEGNPTPANEKGTPGPQRPRDWGPAPGRVRRAGVPRRKGRRTPPPPDGRPGRTGSSPKAWPGRRQTRSPPMGCPQKAKPQNRTQFRLDTGGVGTHLEDWIERGEAAGRGSSIT
jgi:hypothetical protein